MFFVHHPSPCVRCTALQELVDQLLELSSRTVGGLNATPAKRQQIEELVDELEAFCPRNPLRSPLLFGDYEVRGCGSHRVLRSLRMAAVSAWSAGRAGAACKLQCSPYAVALPEHTVPLHPCTRR